MEPFDSLALAAEIAIAITGFSGVVLVFRDGRRSSSARADSILFPVIFSGTLFPLGFIAIAFIADAAAFDPPATWRICSGAQVVSHVFFFLGGGGGTLEERRAFTRTREGWVFTASSLVVALLAALNVVSLHQFWALLVGIWFGIGLSLYSFVQLVFLIRADR